MVCQTHPAKKQNMAMLNEQTVSDNSVQIGSNMPIMFDMDQLNMSMASSIRLRSDDGMSDTH